MTLLLRALLYGILAVLILSACIVMFAVSDEPAVKLNWRLNQNNIARAKKILHEGAKTKPDEIGTLELNREDLELAANYLLNRYSQSAVDVSLQENKLKFSITATLPDNQLGKYLNMTLRLGNVDNQHLPTITQFKAGNLPLPSYLASVAVQWGIRHSILSESFMQATKPIKAVDIHSEKIVITYFSSKETLAQARNFLAYQTGTPVPAIYQQKLAETIAHHNPGWRLSLAELLQPLFAVALQRSTANTAINENRWVIATVNDYVSQQIKLNDNHQNKLPFYSVYLYKRTDLAQHFMGSAAITASVNGQISEAAGIEKELHDSQGQSGFSFIDLTADKAGTLFGQRATESIDSAQKLQRAMAIIKDYQAFMPDPSDLPEHLTNEDFKARFGSTQTAEYQKLSNALDARVASVPIYKLDLH